MEVLTHLIPIAFIGGILMFLAPCTLPLVPAFLASLVPPRTSARTKSYDSELTLRAVLFTIGFTFIFMIFGALAGAAGQSLTHHKTLIAQVGGIIIIIFGFSLLHVLNLPYLTRGITLLNRFSLNRDRRSTSLILGTLFGLGWAPCAGPVLASILIIASQTGTAILGTLLLFVFSLGLAIPFILIGFLYARSLSLIASYGQYAKAISVASGLLLIFLGFFMLLGHFIVMTKIGFTVFSFFGYVPMCTYI